METFLRSKHVFIKHALFGIGFVLLAAGSFECRADQALDSQLIESAKKGNRQAVESLLKQGANINTKNKDGDTALMLAAKYGKKEIVKLLLNKGANELRRAWDAAYRARHIEIAQIIGDAATALNAQLIESAGKGDLLQVKNLLERVSDVDFKNADGFTALMLAAKYGKKEVVQLLLDKGADVNAINWRGETALQQARTEEIKALLRSKGAQ